MADVRANMAAVILTVVIPSISLKKPVITVLEQAGKMARCVVNRQATS